jgi:hypothetical protein
MFARGIVATHEEYTELGIDEISWGAKSHFGGLEIVIRMNYFRGTGVLMGLSLPPITPSNWAVQV